MQTRNPALATWSSPVIAREKSLLPTDRISLLSLETQTQPSSPTFWERQNRPGHRPTRSLALPEGGRAGEAEPLKMPSSPPPTWSGLLAKCESLHLAVQGHRREATHTLNTRKEAWAEAKEYVEGLKHKAVWRKSSGYQNTRKRIERRMLRSEDQNQARDREIILRTVSPSVERGKKPFLRLEFLTPNRLRSLSQVSMRSFGRTPISRQEITDNLARLNHPGLGRSCKSPPLLSSPPPSQRSPLPTPVLSTLPSTLPTPPRRPTPPKLSPAKPLLTTAIHDFVIAQQRRLSRNALFFRSLQRKLEITNAVAATARSSTQNIQTARGGQPNTHREDRLGSGKRAGKEKRDLKLFSETLVLDQLVKARIVKMQRTELLS